MILLPVKDMRRHLQAKNISIKNLSISLVRKWKRPREIGEGTWEFEIGEPVKQFNPESDLLAPSGDNVNLYSYIYYSQYS